jgi:DNA recombination protein RmuC
MDLLVGSAILIVGLLLGAAIAWALNRSREAYRIQAAVSNSQASSLIERAQLEERFKATSEDLRIARDAGEQRERELVAMRADLEKVREEQSRFAERSSRVPALETEVTTLHEQIRVADAELRGVATSEAQKQQQVISLSSQVSQFQSELRDSTARLELSSVALQEANERKAALEEQSARIPFLEANVRDYEEQARKGADELRRVATSEAQKQQLVLSLTEQVAHLELELKQTAETLHQASSQLHETNERKAALEEQAQRIPELERKLANAETMLASATREQTELRESSGRDIERLSAELNGERLAATLLSNELASVKTARDVAQSDAARLTDELTELRTRTEAERQGAEEKLALLLQAKEMLSDQFKTLASDILEEKSKRFTEQNQANLGQLLEPLKTRLTEFQGKVEEVYVQEGKDRSALSEQVRNLVALNQVLSQDAKNLTSALKGSSKTQGNWGELILERVLEGSGLRKGEEYVVQDSQLREDGTRAQPDVVINLPEDRKLVIDSKVSLLAYDKYASAETDEARAVALRQHVDSLRSHIKSLSDKQYQALYGKSLDFVLAFVPIEPAFMLAVWG